MGGLLEFGVLKFLPCDGNQSIRVNLQAGTLQLTPNVRSNSFQKNITGKYLIIRAQDAIASIPIADLGLEKGNPKFNLKYLFRPEILSIYDDSKVGKWNVFDVQHVTMWDTTFYAAKISRSLLLIFDSLGQPPLQIFNRIFIRDKQWLSVKNIGAIAVDFNKHLYAITQNGQLLRGELFKSVPINGQMNNSDWKWTVISQLPISQVWGMRFIDPKTLLISGNVFIRVHIQTRVQPEKSNSVKILTNRSPRNAAKKSRSNAFLFNVLPPFSPGSTYGIGIGQLDSKNNFYLYLADVYNKNRLFIISKFSNFDLIGSTLADYSEKRGLIGRVASGTQGDRDLSLAINFGDVNEDGADDIMMSYLDSTNALYLNNGQGYFRDVSRAYNSD